MSKVIDFVKQGTKLVCVGRNYAKHIAELGNEAPKEPLLFLKPTTSYLESGGKIEYPAITKSLHFEVELGVIIGSMMTKVSAENALLHVAGYTIAVDLTCRDLQEQAKVDRVPWTMAKALDKFCPIGPFVDAKKIDPHNTELVLKVNGEVKQQGNTKDMIYTVPKLLEYITANITLLPGDVVLTGTPDGVGPIIVGDKVLAEIPGVCQTSFTVI